MDTVEHVLRRVLLTGFILLGFILGPTLARAELPQGYLVWSRGMPDDPATRQIYRMSLPGMEDQHALTSGEDVEARISPDGQWVAYAKAKYPGGSDYHNFTLWRPYIVSIHGAAAGRKEIKIDDDGAWPSWGQSGSLFYNQADGTQTRIMRVEIDDKGQVVNKQVWLSTQDLFSEYVELNECFLAPDESWFAGRTRGNTNQNGVSAFVVTPPLSCLVARAGSIGCMPFVAPSGTFAIIAGAGQGIRWGQSPLLANRSEDQLLIPPLSPDHLAYHPAISSDEKWALAAQGTDTDHNAGRYDLYIHPLDTTTMTTGVGQALTADGFNGWPYLWVGTPGPAPLPKPAIADFYASSYTVAPGEAVTLAWSTFGADLVSLTDVPVLADGTLTVQPALTTNYTLLAQSTQVSDSDTQTLSIVVNPTPIPVSIDRFEATPARITKGSSALLRWQVSNATTLVLDGMRTTPQGSIEVSPLITTTYVLTANGQTGPTSAQITLLIDEPKNNLLPDRGGFRCALSALDIRASDRSLVLLGVVALVGRRWLRRRRLH
jgi:hypothetical protein